MAIETVNARYEGFIFDGQNSRNYGVYVTDVEVFGAPVRNVEMIQIPGRNGAYALDNGFYENIQVTYKCAMGCESQADFNAGISAFRNMLASRIGYKRLEDEINTDEYRMACFHGGISVPTLNKDTATFDVVFDCKPHRFLKSGETAVTIGGDVTNPQTKSGSIVSIESDGGDKVTSLVAQITPVQAGSGDPSPTNVRPITGWTAAAVNVAGKNLLNPSIITSRANATVDDGVVTATKQDTKAAFAPVLQAYNGNTYVKNLGYGASDFPRTFVKDGTYDYVNFGHNGSRYDIKCRFYVGDLPNGEYVFSYEMIQSTGLFAWHNMQIEQGNSFTGYEPYKGHTVPVSFGSAAGTVYGGTLDVVTGVLTVTHKFLHLTSVVQVSTQSGAHVYWRFVINEKGINGATAETIICNMAKSAYGEADNTCYVTSAGSLLLLFPEDQTLNTKALVDAWLANHELQICYKLATPQTYNLTAQQVELLTGQNHVWADTGDITITWGDDPNKLVNPTLYNAHPLLSFTASGAGTININNDTISVTNQPIGDIVLANVVKLESGESVTWSDTSRYLTGDAIRIDSIPAVQTTVVMDSYSYANYTNYISDNMDYLSTTSTSRGMLVTHSIPTPPQYVAGTAKSDTYSATVINKVKHKTTGNIVDCTINLTVTIAYDGANNITATNTVTTSIGTASTAVTINTVIVNSTKSSLGGTAYIDLDIGEAYSIDGGAVVSINDSVSIGAALPVLGVGSNTVSKTGSVANLKVTPRWWQL